MTDRNEAFAVELLREKWLTALEQNKYPQCTGMYHNGHGAYCGLGVLMKEGGYGGETWLPEEIAEKAGINEDLIQAIPVLNDDDGYTFPQIAKYIRAEIKAGRGLKK